MKNLAIIFSAIAVVICLTSKPGLALDARDRWALQHDANIICKSRSIATSLAGKYDYFISVCNGGGNRMYSDCTQYNADRMAENAAEATRIYKNNIRDFVRIWGTDAYNSISCY